MNWYWYSKSLSRSLQFRLLCTLLEIWTLRFLGHGQPQLRAEWVHAGEARIVSRTRRSQNSQLFGRRRQDARKAAAAKKLTILLSARRVIFDHWNLCTYGFRHTMQLRKRMSCRGHTITLSKRSASSVYSNNECRHGPISFSRLLYRMK